MIEVRDDVRQRMISSLAATYPVFAPTTIERWVDEEAKKYSAAKIETFVEVLVLRAVDATLQELARGEGTSRQILTLSSVT